MYLVRNIMTDVGSDYIGEHVMDMFYLNRTERFGDSFELFVGKIGHVPSTKAKEI